MLTTRKSNDHDDENNQYNNQYNRVRTCSCQNWVRFKPSKVDETIAAATVSSATTRVAIAKANIPSHDKPPLSRDPQETGAQGKVDGSVQGAIAHTHTAQTHTRRKHTHTHTSGAPETGRGAQPPELDESHGCGETLRHDRRVVGQFRCGHRDKPNCQAQHLERTKVGRPDVAACRCFRR